MSTFIKVDDKILQAAIRRAKNRLVFIAPGVRPAVAQTLAQAMAVLPPDSIHLVFDVDAEVCRLGYGDPAFKGMEILQKAAALQGLTVNHQPGIRLGVLIADDFTLIYSPTPELIEAESSHTDKPNGIQLQGPLPEQLATACGTGEEQLATLEIGHDPVSPAEIEAVKSDLRARPPREFNIARIERVFSSMLHYVELRIEDYKLSGRSMIVNSALFGVSSQEVMRRLTNRYHLFAQTDALTVEIPELDENSKPKGKGMAKFGPGSIDEERKKIKDRFIIEAGDFGLLILRRDVPEFEKAIERLQAQIEAYKQAIRNQIKSATEQLVAELFSERKEKLKANPPGNWKRRILSWPPSDDDIRRLFMDELEPEILRVASGFNPKVFYAFKDVTYHTFKDPKFRKLLDEQFGEAAIERIFSEHDAAPEQ